jgi:hypothetical protein
MGEQNNDVCDQIGKRVDGICHQCNAISQYPTSKFEEGKKNIGNHANDNGSDSCGHDFDKGLLSRVNIFANESCCQ